MSINKAHSLAEFYTKYKNSNKCCKKSKLPHCNLKCKILECDLNNWHIFQKWNNIQHETTNENEVNAIHLEIKLLIKKFATKTKIQSLTNKSPQSSI